MIDLNFLHEVLKDVECELGVEELAMLVTPALDRKIEKAIKMLEDELSVDKENV